MTEIKATESSEKKSLNFIEQIVEKDLKEGKNDGRIQTRLTCKSHLHGLRNSKEIRRRM